MSQPVSSGQVGLNLDHYATFARKEISKGEGEDRYDRLVKMFERINANEKNISEIKKEFDEKEMKMLEDKLYSGNELEGTKIKISRAAVGQFYFVNTVETHGGTSLQKFKDIRTLLIALDKNISGGSERGILQSVADPQGREMVQYREATLFQMKAILQTDFLAAAKHGYQADLYLLSAARGLHRIPDVYEQILSLHSQSFDLYSDQNRFNRSCQLSIIEHGAITQRSANKICRLLEGCGPLLNEIPESFNKDLAEVKKEEANHSIELFKTIARHSKEFSGKLANLANGIEACLKTISKKQTDVAAVIKDMEELQQKRDLLSEKQKALQVKFDAFQKAKNLEHHSRRSETSYSEFLWIFSWSETKVVEADFGSSQLWREYKELMAESRRISQKMESKGKELESKLKKLDHLNTSDSDLDRAAGSLAAAVIAVKDLQSAMRRKELQALSQVETINAQLSNDPSTHGVSDAVDVFSDYRGKILNAHAIWLQTEQQCATIRKVCDDENQIKGLIMKDLTAKTDEGLKMIERRLKDIKSTKDDSTSLGTFTWPTPKALLESRKM